LLGELSEGLRGPFFTSLPPSEKIFTMSNSRAFASIVLYMFRMS